VGEVIFHVAKIIGDRRFSADGSNILFNHIDSTLKLNLSDTPNSIIVDFSSINLVSTSFIGRLQTRIMLFKNQYPSITLRFINLRPEIKRQFLKTKSSSPHA
jgi:anti-anti-sigma regulatory factor